MTSTYDAFDQLTSEGPRNYTYDAAGRLATAGTNTLTYDDTSDTITSDGTENYTRTPDGGSVSLGQGTTSAFAYSNTHGDLIGTFNTTATSMTSSTSYDPWGTPGASTGSSHDISYQGGWTDPTNGQINTASRWYNPAIADFTSRDAAPLNPTTSGLGNLYAYANDNPVSNTDPSGNSPCTGGGGGAGAGAGSGSGSAAVQYPSWDYGGYGNGAVYDTWSDWANAQQWTYQDMQGWFAPTPGYYMSGGYQDPNMWDDLGAAGVLGGGYAGGAGLGVFLDAAPVFVLAASADSCKRYFPPPPPPIDWHKERPVICASSADHCVTASQNGDLSVGGSEGATQQGTGHLAASDLQAAFDPLALTIAGSSNGQNSNGNQPNTCLNNPIPGSTPNSQNGGWEYYAPAGYRGRAEGAVLCASISNTLKNGGSYNTAKDAVGLAAAEAVAALHSQKTAKINNCHLGPSALGGSGATDNVAPCWRTSNYGRGNSMRSFETKAQRAVDGGLVVEYIAMADYKSPTSTIPRGFWLSYIGQDLNGGIGSADSVYVTNDGQGVFPNIGN